MPLAAAPNAPRVEHHTSVGIVLGLGTPRPRLSWSVPSAEAGYTQSAYEIEVARNAGILRYRVQDPAQVLVPWPADPLKSRERAELRVRVADGTDWTDWSPVTTVEAGLLDKDDWSAGFISPTGLGDRNMPAPILQGEINIPRPVAKGRLYATAHGVYVPSLNGIPVADQVLAPGWTAYDHRLRYQTYDVTELLLEGTNSVEFLLGNGWFRGRLGFGFGRPYGDRLALLAQLEVTLDDGQIISLATDTAWSARESEVLAADLYDGQVTDLRRRGKGWYPQTSGVEEVPGDLGRLVAPEGPPLRVTELIAGQKTWQSPSGRTIVDFGQNLVGWVRLQALGLSAGTKVTVRHAEVLQDGELALEPLRSAKATDTYFVSGEGEETLEPSLTFHGFRYIDVEGLTDAESLEINAVAVGSDLRRAGWFSSSHELLDRFHENVVWAMRGNFFDIPMDCPQRDERLGWTGDIQVFAPTATFLYDTAGFLSSWLADLASEQLDDGSVPFVIPDVLQTPSSAAAGWGDAASLVPWTLYERTGDAGILERQFESMRAWVDKASELAGPKALWTGGFQFGDWLDPTAPEDDPYQAKSDADVIATAYLARSASTVAKAAAVLGRHELADEYSQLAGRVRDSFNQAYVTPAGRVHSDGQTVYALAIVWGLLDDEQCRGAGARLADLVRASGYRISTGFLGTPLVCDALAVTGHVNVAHRLLLQTECPSWLYPVTMDATTVWERWDSMLPNGRVNGSGMTSFNHYALGAVADWIHRSVAGLAPDEPGYRHMVVRPQPPKELTKASARHLTPYGEAGVSWWRSDGHFDLDLVVPVGVKATVHLPGSGESVEVEHGRHHWRVGDPHAKGARVTSLRDLMDDSTLWQGVVEAAISSGVAPQGESQAAGKLRRYMDRPFTTVVEALAPPEAFGATGDLEERIARVLASQSLPNPTPSQNGVQTSSPKELLP